ncbi:glycoside hydrolase superfamily [Mariannaea sp. PMI_226]|nr:glycoside hydrolase superfamily [Mariannaea sp. PMI_226]
MLTYIQDILSSKQKPASTETSMNMEAILQTYPPLGQATLVQTHSSSLVAILDVPNSQEAGSWEVCAFLSIDGSKWKDIILLPVDDGLVPQTLQSLSESVSRLYFSAPLAFNNCVQFTLKFRYHQNDDWKWIREEQGIDDGWIIRPSTAPESDIFSLIPDLNVNEWTISSCLSQSPGTNVWALEASVPPADGDSSTFKDIRIGNPWESSFLRWFAVVRLSTPWLAPRHGKDSFYLDRDGILCSFLSHQGKNLVFLAISGISHVAPVFQQSMDGSLSVHARNDGISEGKAIILVSEGADFNCAVAAVMYHARTLVTRAAQASQQGDNELAALSNEIQPQWMESWYDGLGFCTWNALGQRLTDQKIFDAMDKLAQKNINVSSLIIDDNWQSLDYRGHSQNQHGWKEFEADAKGFPKGLKHTVSHIREKHPHVQHIAVWHALLGYWGGLAPDGKIAKSYKTIEVTREDVDADYLPIVGKMTVIAKEDLSRFYDDFYKFLSDCGIDAVKTDAQCMMDTWIDASPRRELFTRYLDAWTISMLRHFSAKAISCMSQVPQILFHSQMPTNRPVMVVRNSDDFFPDDPTSHTWHVWANAHNSIFMQYLNVLPDWDMFQTVHEYSSFHAAARCVSGGPIYITDVPGEHDLHLIDQMTGLTPRGKTVIFRPSVIGKTVYPYAGCEDGLLLKVGSFHGSSQTGNPILAVFNVFSKPLTELIPLFIFPGTDPSLEYVVRAHTTGRVSTPIKIGAPDSLIAAALPVRGYEIFCAYPLTNVTGKRHGSTRIANLGLLGKMTGAAAIVSSQINHAENGRVNVDIRVKAFGVLGVYVSSLPSMTIEGDFMATIQGQPIPPDTVTISEADNHVLEIDIGKAWKEMGLKSGWSNDVEIKIYFSS